MISGFASEGRALFTELTFDGRAIASTCNFTAGNVGFAFKIGWDPEFKAFSPGLLNEVEFMRRAGTEFPDLTYFDSGASADSFINNLWLERQNLPSIGMPTGLTGRAVIAGSQAISVAQRLLSGGIRRNATP
jgi:CelD/BcsL family acetyltransferase involved in cellulose biosynthesis